MNDKAPIKLESKAAQSQAQVSAADSGRGAPYVAPTVIPLSLIDTAGKAVYFSVESGGGAYPSYAPS